MELNPTDISKLMILKKNMRYAMGYRFKSLASFRSNLDWGNFMFTSFFNILFRSQHRIYLLRKVFYKSDLKEYDIISNEFDIDIELRPFVQSLTEEKKVPQIFLNYKRRTIEEGKKLKVSWVEYTI